MSPEEAYREFLINQATPPPAPEVQINDPLLEDTGVPSRDLAGDVLPVLKDLGGGIMETPGAFLRGTSEGIHNIFDAANDAANFMEKKFPLAIPIPKTGIAALDQLLANPAAAIAGPDDVSDQLTDEPESVTGGLVKGITQFMVGFQAKGLKAGARALTKSPIAQAAIKGAGADAFTFDPTEERLSNLILEHTELRLPILSYLASSPDDTRAEGRLKNAIEGLFLGVSADLVIKLIPGLVKGTKFVKAKMDAGEVTPLADAVQRFRDGKSPFPVGMSIEDVGPGARAIFADASTVSDQLRRRLEDRHQIVEIDIERLMAATNADQRIDLGAQTKADDGNIIGTRIQGAKDFFAGDVPMDPSSVGIGVNGGIDFIDGRHRLVAAHQLGRRTAPVVVSDAEAARVREIAGVEEAAPGVAAAAANAIPGADPTSGQINMRIQQTIFENDIRAGRITPDTPGVDPDEVLAIQADQASIGQPEPTNIPEAAARTEERAELRGRSLDDLEENVPVEARTAAPPTVGQKTTAAGGRFLDEDLEAAGPGTNFDQAALTRMFDEAVEETGDVAKDVIEELAAEGKVFFPKDLAFWHAALKLPNRARWWYEISAETFKDEFIGFSDDELSRMIDVVAATSPQADPHQNIRRAVGVMSQDLRGLPIDVDITSAAGVEQALRDAKLEGLKTGSFSGTFQYHLGLDNTPPLSTNDRQVASSFGVTGDDIAGNDVVYEVLSRFYIKMRDQLNQGVGGNSNPYETWQLQALGWVQERTGKGNPDNDDYLEALISLKADLADAGINLPGGKLTKQALMDPRVESVTSGTLERFRRSPVATVETVTSQTPAGVRAAEIAARAQAAGDNVVVRKHEEIVRRSLNALITRRKDLGKASVADVVVEAALGKKPKLSRMEIGRGTFEGTLSMNARIPLPPELSETGRRAVLSILGRALKQDAVPASMFRVVDPGDALPAGQVQTYSIFIRDVEGAVGDDVLQQLQKALPAGHEVNIKKVANGHVVDINPRFVEGGPDGGVGPTLAEVDTAVVGTFSLSGLNISDVTVFPRHHTSDYLEAGDYNRAVADLRREILDDQSKRLAKQELKGDRAAARRILKGGDTSGHPPGRQRRMEKARAGFRERVSLISRADKTSRGVAGEFDKELTKFNDQFGKRFPDEEGQP